MSLKQDFISYVESNFATNPMPDSLTNYWTKFKGDVSEKDTQFTNNGKAILVFLKNHLDVESWKAKDIAEGMMVSSRTVSGSIRKLVNDGYVDKIGQEPTIYSITEKGKEIII